MELNASYPQPTWKQQLWFLSIGLLGAGWLWFAMSRRGIELSPDSVGYLAVAQHLLEGKGFLSYQGSPFVIQPPMYPLTLATLSFFFGFPLTTSALLLNLFLIIVITYVSGKLIFLITESLQISIVACISIIIGVPISLICVHVWSEVLFIFFLSLAFLYSSKFIVHNNRGSLVLFSLSVSGCCFTRYVGIFAVLSFFIFLIFSMRKNKNGKYEILIFILISLIPISTWIARNYLLSETFFGQRLPSTVSGLEVIYNFSDTIASWWLFPIRHFQNKTLSLLLFFFSIITFLIFAMKQIKNLQVLSLIIFVPVYSLFLYISSVNFAHDTVDSRLLSPIFIPLIIILLSFSHQEIYLRLRAKLTKQTQSWIIILGVLVWFTYPALSALALAIEVHQEGKGYGAVHWQASETLAYVRQVHNQLTRLPIYTNDPEGLYFLAHIRAEHLPFWPRPTWPETGRAYLVRFKHAYRGECLDIIEELRQSADIEPLVQFSDGEIYLVTHKSLQASSH